MTLDSILFVLNFPIDQGQMDVQLDEGIYYFVNPVGHQKERCHELPSVKA